MQCAGGGADPGLHPVADYFDLGGVLPRVGEVNLYLRHALIALIMSA